MYPQSYTDTKEKDLVKLATRGGAYLSLSLVSFKSATCKCSATIVLNLVILPLS